MSSSGFHLAQVESALRAVDEADGSAQERLVSVIREFSGALSIVDVAELAHKYCTEDRPVAQREFASFLAVELLAAKNTDLFRFLSKSQSLVSETLVLHEIRARGEDRGSRPSYRLIFNTGSRLRHSEIRQAFLSWFFGLPFPSLETKLVCHDALLSSRTLLLERGLTEHELELEHDIAAQGLVLHLTRAANDEEATQIFCAVENKALDSTKFPTGFLSLWKFFYPHLSI